VEETINAANIKTAQSLSNTVHNLKVEIEFDTGNVRGLRSRRLHLQATGPNFAEAVRSPWKMHRIAQRHEVGLALTFRYCQIAATMRR